VERRTFEAMVAVLSAAKRKQKAAGGKPNTLGIEDQLLMRLEYWREYRTYFHIGQAYGLSESAAYRNIKWCENTLAKSKTFRLPGRKTVVASERVFDIALIDATEAPVEKPKKTMALLFGQEEAAHAENPAGRRESDTPHSLSRARKRTPPRLPAVQEVEIHLRPETKAVVDSGYQGLPRQHPNTAMPKKRSKNKPLSASDKERNRAISSERVPCENIVAMLKRFKIIADRYRNRRRRFGLRFFLIAAIYNLELKTT
jgi:Helix-turn-helix of DDE superfamily endonuclease/DDE superfamily endonuclease